MSWESVTLGDVATINPHRPDIKLASSDLVTFVPMESVDSMTGAIVTPQVRPFGEVRKGYTVFTENDVTFAKITPCMQNGKHAIARNLVNGLGFGSTEFHVIRPGTRILPEWIHFFLRKQDTLDAAVKTFTGTVGQQRVPDSFLEELQVPLPSLAEQHRIAARLKAQLAAVEEARQAAQAQVQELTNLANAIVHESLDHAEVETTTLGHVLDEIKQGIGETWAQYPVLGATRDGLALAKEPVGKKPGRYKPVWPGTVFYNPMRILIGSIAMVDEGDTPGITSPDYVVLRGRENIMDSRWFYYWLRSPHGERCILSLARGAVRERMLFNRLSDGKILLPPYPVQLAASRALAQIRPLKAKIEMQLCEIEVLPIRLLAQAFQD